MGEAMALRDEDIGRIGDYVKPWLRSVVEDMIPRHEPAGVGAQLLERMVRVEEELKAQRQLMDERFGFHGAPVRGDGQSLRGVARPHQ